MTKTEKRLLELCELVDAYFQLEQPTVKKAVESQLKEQTKEITEEITAKKKNIKISEISFPSIQTTTKSIK